MQKITFTALAAALLGGCASAPPEPNISSYTYDSKAHSGTVVVTEKHYSSDALACEPKWREGEVYQPTGLPPMGRDTFKVSIEIEADREGDEGYNFNRYSIDVPQGLGSRVLARDFQRQKTFMLGAESNGLVQQGELFEFPEGFYLRVSRTAVQGSEFVACIGIDHMYVLDSELQSSVNPPVYLDRVVIPFAMEPENQPVKVSFGNKIQHTAEIRVLPK
ncbi:hypothetical protein CJU35_03905 [Pseudomonas aeruginosa]|uniref:hypothetical protein n=1 Tax=Pseudomonas aeruginosa TaxID=287 RepID=UPI000BB9895B|nr:hypothetical protein [Pseudomonas aeruginosa]ELQ8318013.1 hypothetical protein [Pseudomonas aeruginosa]PBV09007.1 hypothetical protein CJU35_03905 [Pseudomonas aeruginosa]HBO7921582.1 hypothetical protein [Pseudomonas aeruginosa]HEC1428858.1 hypothetical protein [Pseudomonas aeruginosa]